LLILPGYIRVSDEPLFHQLISEAETPREERFRIEVRNRDRKCVISGLSNPEFRIANDKWSGFEAAHIFPLRNETLWIDNGYKEWITDMDDAVGSSRIHSTQNGFLLQATIHRFFDQYLVSVNPDDGHKVIVFIGDFFNCDGRILDPACRNPSDLHRVSDHVLRWHFRQSVLANLRGPEEPNL